MPPYLVGTILDSSSWTESVPVCGCMASIHVHRMTVQVLQPEVSSLQPTRANDYADAQVYGAAATSLAAIVTWHLHA